MRHAIKYPVLREILGTRLTEISTETGKTMFIKNTNKLLWSDEDLLGGKTGYTNQARHCFVCFGERDKETLVVALLGSPRRDLLWKETEELLGFGAKVLNNNEEPVVYLTRTDYDVSRVTRASYTPKRDIETVRQRYKGEKSGKSALRAGEKTSHKSARMVAGKKAAHKKQVATGKKAKKRTVVAGKKTTKQRLAGSSRSKKSIAKDKNIKMHIAKKGNDGSDG
jgi:D-alanyl-D-alanine carboxypeptidase (penicillin-binding protein 5/6)